MVGWARPRTIPVKLPIWRADRDVIDAGVPLAHETLRTKGPVLIAVGSEPSPGQVMPFIGEADGDMVFGKGPKLLDQPVVALMGPLSVQEDEADPASGRNMVRCFPHKRSGNLIVWKWFLMF